MDLKLNSIIIHIYKTYNYIIRKLNCKLWYHVLCYTFINKQTDDEKKSSGMKTSYCWAWCICCVQDETLEENILSIEQTNYINISYNNIIYIYMSDKIMLYTIRPIAVLKSTIICFRPSPDGEVTIRLPVFRFVVATTSTSGEETLHDVISTKCIFAVFIIISSVFHFYFCRLWSIYIFDRPATVRGANITAKTDDGQLITRAIKLYDGYCTHHDGQYYWLQVVCVSLLFTMLTLLSCHVRVIVLLSVFSMNLIWLNSISQMSFNDVNSCYKNGLSTIYFQKIDIVCPIFFFKIQVTFSKLLEHEHMPHHMVIINLIQSNDLLIAILDCVILFFFDYICDFNWNP